MPFTPCSAKDLINGLEYRKEMNCLLYVVYSKMKIIYTVYLSALL